MLKSDSEGPEPVAFSLSDPVRFLFGSLPEFKAHGTSDDDKRHEKCRQKPCNCAYVGIPDYYFQSKHFWIAEIFFAKKEFDPFPTICIAGTKPQDSGQLFPPLGIVDSKVSVQLVLVYNEPHQGYDAGYK